MTASKRILPGLFLALVVPCLGLTRFMPPIAGIDPLYVHETFWWALLAIVLLYVLFIERRPLSSIGFHRPGWLSILLAVGAAVLLVAGIMVIYSVLFPLLHLRMNTAEMNKLLRTPFWYRFLLVTRAAMMEETLFRGYGIERLRELTANRWIAGAIALAAFTLAHLSSWGWAQLMIALWGGLVLTALYLWRRNLWANMIAHWLSDAAGFLMPHG